MIPFQYEKEMLHTKNFPESAVSYPEHRRRMGISALWSRNRQNQTDNDFQGISQQPQTPESELMASAGSIEKAKLVPYEHPDSSLAVIPRHNIDHSVSAVSSEYLMDHDLAPLPFDEDTPPSSIPVTLIPRFARLVKDGGMKMPHAVRCDNALHGTRMLRKLLQLPRYENPISEIVNTGVVPTIIDHLRWAPSKELKKEAAFFLCLLAFGSKEHRELNLTQSISRKSYIERIRSIYGRCCPDKLPSLARKLDEFKGREQLLLEALIHRYGPEPTESNTADEHLLADIKAYEQIQNHCRDFAPYLLRNLDAALKKFKAHESILALAVKMHFDSTGCSSCIEPERGAAEEIGFHPLNPAEMELHQLRCQRLELEMATQALDLKVSGITCEESRLSSAGFDVMWRRSD